MEGQMNSGLRPERPELHEIFRNYRTDEQLPHNSRPAHVGPSELSAASNLGWS